MVYRLWRILTERNSGRSFTIGKYCVHCVCLLGCVCTTLVDVGDCINMMLCLWSLATPSNNKTLAEKLAPCSVQFCLRSRAQCHAHTHSHTYRHLNLAQTVSLCIVTAGDAMERARLLHRFIEVASLLQSGKYGNLFSFIAVMQGMAIPQVGYVSCDFGLQHALHVLLLTVY